MNVTRRALGPHPEEAPISGVPEIGCLDTKSATADLVCAVSKDGPQTPNPPLILRDAMLRIAPQDEDGDVGR